VSMPEMLFGPPPSEEQRKQMQADAERAQQVQQLAMQQEIEHRERVLYWAALLCTCRPYYRRDAPEPAAAYCTVHSSMIVTLDGRVL